MTDFEQRYVTARKAVIARDLARLNPMQRQGAMTTEGPLLLLAGAGSGKTTVLIQRVYNLLTYGRGSDSDEVPNWATEEDLDFLEHFPDRPDGDEVRRVHRLCAVDAPRPWEIIAITFTNKAAGELKERLAARLGPAANDVWASTFHSACVRILRRDIDRIGFEKDFTIYDTDDAKRVIKDILKEQNLDEKTFPIRSVLSAISASKDRYEGPEVFRKKAEAANDWKNTRIAKIYAAYQQKLSTANALDFDDIIYHTVTLLQKEPEVLDYYQKKFRYVLVDEYQDTNYAQHSIVLQLTKENQRVCVVGDDAQSIYSFRGADIDNILYFTKVYPNTKVFKLEQNYRSTQTIVCAANSLIEKNERQIRKEVFSEKERGEPIGVFQAYSDVEEGDIVANKIAELRREHSYGYADFAILYRTNAQSRVFEEALRKRSMPYKIYGGLSFYQRKEIKDVIAYFRLVVNPNDEEAFKRIINYPARGIGDTTVGKIISAATENGVSLWAALCEPLSYGLNINKGTHTKLQGFRELIEGFMTDQVDKSAYEIGTDIIRRSGIINDVCQDTSPENLSRKENIEELVNGMNDFCALRQEEGNPNISLTDFLSEIALLTDQDSDKADDGEKITLMTVHSAKGLEFKNVFVVGLEENLFPSGMVGDSPRALEEERRLFYVAITRAEEHCYISFAKTRFRYGKMEFGSPSRFLRDIDVNYLRLPHEAGVSRSVDEGAGRFRREIEGGFTRAASPTRTPYGTKFSDRERPKAQVIAPTVPKNLKKVSAVSGSSIRSASAGSASVTGVQAGQMIEHERFGLGEVIRVEGTGDNAKATIHFKNAGDKQLLLRFARFKVIE